MRKLFEVVLTSLEGLIVLNRKPFKDDRGSFERMFCAQELDLVLGNRHIVQINLSKTMQKGAIRGMHFQYPPHSEMKLVSCISGKVFDVAVDLRADSPTYLQWHGEILSEKNDKTIVIPEGFAHGFQVLSESCNLIYFHTKAYNQASEDGVSPMDNILSINWPLSCANISTRDKNFPDLNDRSVKISL